MKWILTALVVWLVGGPGWAQTRYWDSNYDSLARTLPRQRTDTARLRTLVHLLDLHPTGPRALPLLNQLLALAPRVSTFNARPYRRLRAGVALWQQGDSDAAALDSMQTAVAVFDGAGRAIPIVLIDLVVLYNRLNRFDARRRYYDGKLKYYRLHGPTENLAACHVSQGAYYRRMGDHNRTLNNVLKAGDLCRHTNQAFYVRELVVAGDVYADWNNRPKALHYLRMALELPAFRRLQGMERTFTFLALSRLYADADNLALAARMADSAALVRHDDPREQAYGRACGLLQKAAILLKMQQPAAAAPLLARAQQLDDSLHIPMSGKPGEFELDATWAAYYTARHDYARAETHWHRAYTKATAAKLDRLRPKYLRQLATFYDARNQPALAGRYSRAYIGLMDTFNTAQASFHVAQYEGERVEQAQNAQINALRQGQAVQDVRMRLGQRLLIGALLAVLAVSALGVLIYRQLQVNRRNLAHLRIAQGQLVQAEKMAFLRELTAGIAHELQNPLTFVKNFAEVSTGLVDTMGVGGAGLEEELVAGLKQNLQQISQHGQRASAIIADMLAHSRTGTAQRQLADLNALASEYLGLAFEAMKTRVPAFEARLHTRFDPALPPLPVVPPDLGRVLLNLGANACYAVHQSQLAVGIGYVPEVTVTTQAVPGAVEIRVRDNGIGMTAEVLANVFRPFFTTKPASEGTGLGLSLSRDIVTKGHGGTLTVSSQEGVGTEFVLTLPLA